ncbi:MAG: hypothetical protein DMG40_19915 [Acidobacteria bacterium]|nr:MAG: hypothetical protein DMG40_19915 [Acidobacteriota bacterium]
MDTTLPIRLSFAGLDQKGKFRAALPCKLPFEAEVVICEARDLLRVAKENPFGAESHGEL